MSVFDFMILVFFFLVPSFIEVAASYDYFLLSPAYHNNLLDLHDVIVVSTDDESGKNNFKSQF